MVRQCRIKRKRCLVNERSTNLIKITKNNKSDFIENVTHSTVKQLYKLSASTDMFHTCLNGSSCNV